MKSKINLKNYPSKTGHFDEFGGVYVSETLIHPLEELFKAYKKIATSASFKRKLNNELKDYVGRPTPIYYAESLSKYLGSSHIYLKREDLNHTGAHKINNALGQAMLAKKMGKTRIIAETGAGQHGVATATACARLNLKCVVYMGEEDIKRQSVNVYRMKLLGAEVISVDSGTKTLKDALNEALRDWVTNVDDTHYIIGSVVGPHPYPDMVARFQSVISAETKKQLMEKEGRDYPDYVIACVGGGSNAAGLYYHFLDDLRVNIIAVEAAGKGIESGKSAATSVLGKEGIIHGSKTLLMQTSDGQITEPYSISAGLDYPGVGPMHAHLYRTQRAQFISIPDQEAMDWGLTLSQMEGIIPAIETAHAFAALDMKKFKKNEIIVFNCSGRGDKDLDTYIDYFKL